MEELTQDPLLSEEELEQLALSMTVPLADGGERPPTEEEFEIARRWAERARLHVGFLELVLAGELKVKVDLLEPEVYFYSATTGAAILPRRV